MSNNKIFVIYPIDIPNKSIDKIYINKLLLPISLYMLINSDIFVATPVIKNVIAMPGEAPADIIKGICPNAHTYIMQPMAVIPTIDTNFGLLKYCITKDWGITIINNVPKKVPTNINLLISIPSVLNPQIMP